MTEYLDQLESCLRAKLYYPALALALALPDICADIEGLRGGYTARSINWLDSNQKLIALDSAAIVSLRHAFLHGASPELGDRAYEGRFELREPPVPAQGIRVHRAVYQADASKHGHLDIEVEEFIRAIIHAVRRWADRNHPAIIHRVAEGTLLRIQGPRQSE